MTAAIAVSRERPIAQVLLDSALPQLDHLFDYKVSAELSEHLRVGHRVRVPFRSQTRQSFGYVIDFAERSDFGGELQEVSEIIGEVPPLTQDVFKLARAIADRAGGSASDILRLAIPKRMIRAEKQHLAGLAPDPGSNDQSLEPDPAERDIAELLMTGARLTTTESHGPVRLSTGEWVGGWALHLARLALSVHAAGRSAILITPDYRDADQLFDALVSLGHAGAVRVDSRQSGSARYAGFLRALDNKPRVILGNRSAVYAPAHRLGAIFMWDDGDPLLSEPLAPYVHSRDAALMRAQQAQHEPIGLLFASHARSAEVQRLVNIGYIQAETSPPRRTKIIAADAVQGSDSRGARVPEFAARALREGLSRGPVLVQVATPGYAPVAVCQQCNTRASCTVCHGPLRFMAPTRIACRWCGEHATAWRCGQCQATQLAQRGAGSELTAEQFQKQFSGTRVLLSDGSHPVERVDSRPVLVVATRGAEPIAAGGYAAVVLLDVDKLLGIESLRAGEDCLRWWENAAAMAGQDAQCVIASGGDGVVQAFVTGRVEAWLSEELHHRHMLRYPPAVRVASVIGGKTEVERALATLGWSADQPNHDLANTRLPGVDVLGPTSFTRHESGADSHTNSDARSSLVRAIVRFEYSQGSEVAKRLRGALVADAAGASSRVAGRSRVRARAESLRLRFDDRGVFDG